MNRNTASRVTLPSLTVTGEFIVKPGWDTGERLFPFYGLIYFPTGSQTRYVRESEVFVLDSPCYVLTPPRMAHRFIFDPEQPNRHVFFHFDYEPASPEIAPELFAEQPAVISASEASLLPSYIRQIVHIAHAEQRRWKVRCNELLLVVLEELNALHIDMERREHSSAVPLQIRKTLAYIEQNYASAIRIEECAARVGWSHEHLTRLFVRYTGLTPQQAVNEKRIEKACQLLIRETWSVKQIAYFTGFLSEAYFCRSFKKLRGMTPSAYRLMHADPSLQHLSIVDENAFPYSLNRKKYFRET